MREKEFNDAISVALPRYANWDEDGEDEGDGEEDEEDEEEGDGDEEGISKSYGMVWLSGGKGLRITKLVGGLTGVGEEPAFLLLEVELWFVLYVLVEKVVLKMFVVVLLRSIGSMLMFVVKLLMLMLVWMLLVWW